MNEASKHAIWILGLLGSITVGDWNEIAGIACAVAGCIAASLSIYSFFEKRRRRARELAAPAPTAEAGRSKQEVRKGRRHHHLWLFWVLVGLMVAWALIAAAKGKETAGLRTTDYGAGAGSPVQAAALSGSRTAALSRDAATDAWAVQVADDVRKLAYDFLSGFSWAGLFAAYLGAKGLRNFTPLGRSAGSIGTLLRLINLEANREQLLTSSPTGGTPGEGTGPTGAEMAAVARPPLREVTEQINKTQ